MSAFSDEEIEYLQSHRLGRLATVGRDNQPHVTPLAYRYNADEDSIDVGGRGGFASGKKWRDVQHNPLVAFVVDDVATEPRRVRGIEIRGQADTLDTGGKQLMEGFDDEMFRIRPKRVRSWGLKG
jgi:pyridoxamine 5'-phosphate oxidase family protein